MFVNLLKTAWRSILRHPSISLINITGLSLGMAASLLLYIYVSYERSFDRFHPQHKKIYRITTTFGDTNAKTYPLALPQSGPMIREESPLVADYARVKAETTTFLANDSEFEGRQIYFTDPGFARLFQFGVLKGDLEQTLMDPGKVAISRHLAESLFGDQDPINQPVTYYKLYFNENLGRWALRSALASVGAVLDHLPGNTHFRFDALVSFEALDPSYLNALAIDISTYLLLNKDPQLQEIEDISATLAGYASNALIGNYEIDVDLQKLTDIHFGEKFLFELGPTGNKELIRVFVIIAMAIMVIAMINFINLSTARSEKRCVEAGIRKVCGARRRDIFRQFIGEAIILAWIAFFFAMVIVETAIGPFSSLMDRDLSMEYSESLMLFFRLSGIAWFTGFLSGLYPAALFSRFQPVQIFRGASRKGRRNPALRIMLVVFQFGVSAILIIGIQVFYKQVNYMKTSSLGFDKEQLIIYRGVSMSMANAYPALSETLKMHPAVLDTGVALHLPGVGTSGMTLRQDIPGEEDIPINEMRVGPGFPSTFGLELTQGRWWDFELASDRNHFIINESAAKVLGVPDPVGKDVVMFRRRGQIIGVVRDFHYQSMKSGIDPLILTAYTTAVSNICIRIDNSRRSDALAHIQKTIEAFDPSYSQPYWDIDAYFDAFYTQEEKTNRAIGVVSLLAIIIAILGLYGLSSYMVAARQREIALRKILGSGTLQIVLLLFKDIIRWVLVANIIAWPVAYLLLDAWLNNYPYRISWSVVPFAVAGVLTLLIAAITVSGQTFRAARAEVAGIIREQ